MKSLHLALFFLAFLVVSQECGKYVYAGNNCPCSNGVRPCYPQQCDGSVCYCCLSSKSRCQLQASLEECKASCPCIGCPQPPPCTVGCRPPTPWMN